MSNDLPAHRQSLYTTRTNKISSTLSVTDPLTMQQQQSESMLTNRQSHRKYKLSHSQITKIDKLSRQGLLRWKQSHQSQDQTNNKNITNKNNTRSSNNKSRTSQKSLQKKYTKNMKQQEKNSIINKQELQGFQDNNNKNQNQPKNIYGQKAKEHDNIIITSDRDSEIDDINKNKKRRSNSNNSSENNIIKKNKQTSNLHEIKQATTSMHSINYQLRKDKIIRLKQQQLTLHVEIIIFDMNKQYMKSKKQVLWQTKKQVTFKNFQQQQQYQQQQRKYQNKQQKQRKYENKQQRQNQNIQQRQRQKQQRQRQNIIEVICFQIHDKKINMHYRSQFSYKTLGKDVKFLFEDIQELFQYVTCQEIYETNNQQNFIHFNHQTMQLQIKIVFNYHQQQLKLSTKQLQQLQSYQKKKPKQRTKTIKIPLLPFAVIQIIEHHPHQLQLQTQKKQLTLEIAQLKRDLQASTNLIHALRDQNDKLKLKLKKQKSQTQKEKAQKQLIIESYQKLSKVSQVTNKQYYFQFIPDIKAKNYTYFTFKNNILKKVKNDLKWDQVSSQAPLPKAGKHYFSFLIKDFLPDFMFGIVTMKAKDTSNAFLGLQTICLYASKNNCYIYQRGKHYKISVSVKRNDTVFVIVDRQKNVIEWVKKKGQGMSNDKQRSPQAKDEYKMQSPHIDHNTSLTSINPHIMRTQDDMPVQNPHYHHLRQRKTSQIVSSTQFLANQLSQISILPLTTAVDYAAQQIDYIHSTTIPQEMLTKEMYGYLQVYNINQPIKLNERK